MIPLNTPLGLPGRAFWYVALRSFVVALLVVVLGSVVALVTMLPGARCNGHACDPAAGAHIAAFIYLFAAFLVVRAALNFKWYSFVVTDRNISITSGVLARDTSTIRFDRVQDVTVRRDPLHALLGLKSIAIWTASPDQRVGSARRPDGSIVLDADDAEWLRDYVSDPPATAAAGVTGARGQAAAIAVAPQRNNGPVVAAFVVAGALVVLAVIGAREASVPPPAGIYSATATVQAPRYLMRRGADGKTHLRPAHSAPDPATEAPAASAAAADPPPVAAVRLPAGAAGIACAVHPQQATRMVPACGELPIAERCNHEMDYPSKPTEEPATLTVMNKSSAPLKFYWLNQSGNRQLYATLPPGARVDQPSHTGAHWLFASVDGQCLGVVDAATMKIGIF